MFLFRHKGTPMSKKGAVILLVLVFGAYVFLKFWGLRMPEVVIDIGGTLARVEVATTPDQQYRGLGGRDTLGDRDGMLFLFQESGTYGFVMRDMKFPIDIIWFHERTIVDIAPHIPTEEGVDESVLRRYYPRLPAELVLEVPAGWAEEHGLKIGDTMEIVRKL